jgi:hypothetical protein
VEEIEIPQDLTVLSAEDLEALAATLVEAVTTLGAGPVSAESAAQMTTYADAVEAIDTVLATRAAEAQALSASHVAALGRIAGRPAPVAVETPEVTAAAEPVVAIRTPSAAALAAVAPSTSAPAGAPKAKSHLGVSGMVWADDVPNQRAGENVPDVLTLAAAMTERADVLRRGASEPKVVATLMGAYDELHTLSGNAAEDVLKLSDLDEEITAALCAPFTPYYEIGGQSSTVRPISNALAQFAAPRGGVSIYPTPRLADIVDGLGVWTSENDADDNALKEIPAEISCGTPAEFKIYGVYRSLKVKDMLALTFPELIAAYQNRLFAKWSQLAERRLLDAMYSEADALYLLNTPGNPIGHNAVGTWLGGMLRTLQIFKELERYDDQPFDAFVHESVNTILTEDQLNGYATGTGSPMIADVNAVLRDRGINVHYSKDRSTNALLERPLPAPINGGRISEFSSQVDVILTPRGNFRKLDRGMLNLGTAGNVLRDTTTVRRNEFVMFQEGWEGLVNLGAQVWHLRFNLCASGNQPPRQTNLIDCTETS